MRLAIRGLAGILCILPAMSAPAQDSADVYMTRLSVLGKVMVENGRPAQPGIDAHTKFDLTLQSSWNWSVDFPKSGTGFLIAVTPQITRADISVRHSIVIPSSKDHDYYRYRALLLHEYDHVALSCDDRAKVLLTGLLRGMGTIQKPWRGAIPAPNSEINALVQKEIEARKEAVVSLIRGAYDRLDSVTNHGRAALRNRAEAFEYLFSLEFMKESKFPYLAEAEKILQTAEFRNAKRYYRP